MTCVSANGRITPGCTGLYTPKHEAGWKRIVDFIHAETKAKVCCQIGHAGRKGSTQVGWADADAPLVSGNWPLLSASAIAWQAGNQVPKAMDRADMDAALAQYDQVLDVAPDELIGLLRRAEGAAYQRLWGTLMCSDLMTPNPETVDIRTPLAQAWAHMQRLQIKAMPVIDQSRHVVGIVSRADLLRTAYRDVPMWGPAQSRPPEMPATRQPQTVGEIMTRQVRVASAASHALDLLPLFSAAGHHHLPVIDGERRLVGILTQTDLVRALSRVVAPV
jgi:CBS-domain-containing membrane protein